MYSKQDLSHVTKYDQYDRYSIDSRLGQYEGRVGKWKFFIFFFGNSTIFNDQFFVRVLDTLYELGKKVKMD